MNETQSPSSRSSLPHEEDRQLTQQRATYLHQEHKEFKSLVFGGGFFGGRHSTKICTEYHRFFIVW